MALSAGLSTAAVFHLMKVLEVGLDLLGKKFGITLANSNWGPIIDQIEKAVNEMHNDRSWSSLPDFKDQEAFYSQATSHFRIVKNAWRNYTMHGRTKYTETESVQIFESTRAFMQKLSERLSE